MSSSRWRGRNSYKQITSCAPKWLWDSLVLEKAEDLEPEDDLREMWLACGIDSELVEELVRLRLLCRGGKIVVCEEENNAGLFDRVMYCLFSLWHVRKFSESRWASVGLSCRLQRALAGLGLWRRASSAMRASPTTGSRARPILSWSSSLLLVV